MADPSSRNAWRYAAVTAGLCASAPVLAGVLRWAVTGRPPGWLQDRVEQWRDADRPPARSDPDVRYRLELTRLAEELQGMRRQERPGQFGRLHTTTAAYDAVLIDCARSLGFPEPTRSLPLSNADRYDLETRLIAAGVHW